MKAHRTTPANKPASWSRWSLEYEGPSGAPSSPALNDRELVRGDQRTAGAGDGRRGGVDRGLDVGNRNAALRSGGNRDRLSIDVEPALRVLGNGRVLVLAVAADLGLVYDHEGVAAALRHPHDLSPDTYN